MKVCSLPQCERPHRSRGYCRLHDYRQRNGLPLSAPVKTKTFGTAPERFWQKVAKSSPDNCWLWLGWTNKDGYGEFRLSDKNWRAHRYSYFLLYGVTDLHILHSCDTPSCVNPHHLRTGTNHDNVQDKVSKGRQYKGMKHHQAKLTEAKVLWARRQLALGCKSSLIAKELGVSECTVCRIKYRKTWAHLR